MTCGNENHKDLQAHGLITFMIVHEDLKAHGMHDHMIVEDLKAYGLIT